MAKLTYGGDILNSVKSNADYVKFNNSGTGLSAETVQEAVSEVSEDIKYKSDLIIASDETKKIKFGIDSSGNYGYYKDGADTVTPFKHPDDTLGKSLSITNYTFDGTYTVATEGDDCNYDPSVTVKVAAGHNFPTTVRLSDPSQYCTLTASTADSYLHIATAAGVVKFGFAANATVFGYVLPDATVVTILSCASGDSMYVRAMLLGPYEIFISYTRYVASTGLCAATIARMLKINPATPTSGVLSSAITTGRAETTSVSLGWNNAAFSSFGKRTIFTMGRMYTEAGASTYFHCEMQNTLFSTTASAMLTTTIALANTSTLTSAQDWAFDSLDGGDYFTAASLDIIPASGTTTYYNWFRNEGYGVQGATTAVRGIDGSSLYGILNNRYVINAIISHNNSSHTVYLSMETAFPFYYANSATGRGVSCLYSFSRSVSYEQLYGTQYYSCASSAITPTYVAVVGNSKIMMYYKLTYYATATSSAVTKNMIAFIEIGECGQIVYARALPRTVTNNYALPSPASNARVSFVKITPYTDISTVYDNGSTTKINPYWTDSEKGVYAFGTN